MTELLADMLGIEDLQPATELVESNLLDSVSVANLVLDLERAFSVQIPDVEITPENFSTVTSIASFCDRLMAR